MVIEAVQEPATPCTLLVASALIGGIWASNKTGIVIKPPPLLWSQQIQQKLQRQIITSAFASRFLDP